jgi:hypothetical protein
MIFRHFPWFPLETHFGDIPDRRHNGRIRGKGQLFTALRTLFSQVDVFLMRRK